MAALGAPDDPADFISFAPHAVRVRANTAAAVAAMGLMTMWFSFERRGADHPVAHEVRERAGRVGQTFQNRKNRTVALAAV
ncbi:hypothetical protein GCM10009856_10230 [Mycolicibacterium llatzerense]